MKKAERKKQKLVQSSDDKDEEQERKPKIEFAPNSSPFPDPWSLTRSPVSDARQEDAPPPPIRRGDADVPCARAAAAAAAAKPARLRVVPPRRRWSPVTRRRLAASFGWRRRASYPIHPAPCRRPQEAETPKSQLPTAKADRSTSDAMPLLRRLPAAPHRTPIHHDQHLHLFNTHNTRNRGEKVQYDRATISSLPVTCLRIRYSSNNPVRHLRGIPSSRCHAAADPAPSKIPGGGSGALEAGVVGWRDLLLQVGEVLSLGFPVWVASACAVALWRPPAFLWVSPMAQIVGISFTMLGMGMTLTLDDLKTALLMPKELAAGFLLQYSVMPLSGFLISKLLNLPTYYAAGLILVSCCPGASLCGRGNVALSVLMTAASTFAAAFLTPLLTSKLAGQYVAVDPMGLFVSTSQVVLAPVLLGALLNQYCNGLVQLVSPLMPFIAVATVAVLCGNAIAQNASAILSSGLQVVMSVCWLHASGFFFGYVLSRTIGIDISSSRTISIEVGMQNSVLGVVLASKHFGNPLTAVPCAVSSVCHSVYGSLLAGIWRSLPPNDKGQ
uniref:Uncharacterized protein n=2 Tax=Oryza TaxID=4527 RepID=A0A0E0DDB9_9ORYZ